MIAETLDADFYRLRAQLCFQLANSAHEAKPLSLRLYSLAADYSEKAKAAESVARLSIRQAAAISPMRDV